MSAPSLAFSPRRRRALAAFAMLAALTLAGWVGASAFAAHRLTGRAAPPQPEPLPSLAWATSSALRLTTIDGEELGAWWLDAGSEGPVVLLLHPRGGARSGMLEHARLWVELGCDVLLLTMRAHGDSTGARDDAGYGARFDVLAAVELVATRRPDAPLVIHGWSMGAAAAIFAAPLLAAPPSAAPPPAGGSPRPVAAYVLDSPYRDLRHAIRDRTRLHLPPVLDQVAYAGLVLVAPLFLEDLDAVAPIRHIGAIDARTPVLLIAGGRDARAPPDGVRELQAQVPSHGTLHVFEEGGHDDHLRARRDEYAALLRDLLSRLPPR